MPRLSRELYRLHRPALVLLAPLLAIQGIRVRRSMPVLPASEGPWGSQEGGPAELRLLLLGDSLAAGVGAQTHRAAFAGQLASALADREQATVRWRVIAQAGATARDVRRHLLAEAVAGAAAGPPHVIVVVVGMNDLLRRRTLKAWRADVEALLADVPARFGRPDRLLVAGLPPIGQFPSLPQPLRTVMGWRATAMDRILARAATEANAVHVPLPIEKLVGDRAAAFARDGFHPSPVGYTQLGRFFAEAARPGLLVA